MKVSIITICLNNKKNISNTIESVISQTHKDIEYIVIDGGSSDGTLEIINSYKSDIDIIISEKDNGIYSAMNKGIAKASGEVLGILNSGDVYHDNKVIKSIVNFFRGSEAELIYGHSLVFDKNRLNIVRKNISPVYKKNLMKLGWFPSHQSIFYKTSVFSKYGNYNEVYKIASDYEFLLRMIYVHNIKPIRINLFVIKFYLGGASSKSFKNIYYSNIECINAWNDNNLKMPFYTIPFKILRKLVQNLLQIVRVKK